MGHPPDTPCYQAGAPQATPRPQYHSDPAPFSALHSWGPHTHLFPGGLGPPAVPDTPTSGMFQALTLAPCQHRWHRVWVGGRVTGRRLFLEGGQQAPRLAKLGRPCSRASAGPEGRGPCPALLWGSKLEFSIRLCSTWAEGLTPFLSTRLGVLTWYHQAEPDGPRSIPLILSGPGSRQGSLDLGTCFY